MRYRDVYEQGKTSQRQQIPGREDQVKNSAGGFVFEIGPFERLGRFLVLGSEGPTFYASARKLTLQNASCVRECLRQDGPRAVETIVDVSHNGRAPKNDPAIFALAMAIRYGDDATRAAAYRAVPLVCRIPTHVFNLLEDLKALGKGWSRGLRNAISNVYNKDPDTLAYHLVKYRQRAGWTHRDVLRMAHVKPESEAHNILFDWAVNGWPDIGPEPHPAKSAQMVWAYERARRAEGVSEIVKLITDYKLPWEALDSKWLREPDVWAALLPGMPLTAMIRNLGRMTHNGLLAPFSDAVDVVITKLSNGEHLRRSRVHPLTVLIAQRIYAQGYGMRGSLTWSPVPRVINALDDAFYLSFGNVTPTGKNTLLALDVSGSMGFGKISGMPITPREASAAMAMLAVRTEPKTLVLGFSHELVEIPLSRHQRLDDVVSRVSRMNFGATDCALPMLAAMDRKTPVESFVIYTDNETWFGDMHPVQALDRYQKAMNIPAKVVVVGMTATEFSIADPTRGDMLDVVGFDTAAPMVMNNFLR
ncbi:TROVE domain-containing protein [Candidatus Uhrbacteria bacterium]|nr:TROVE domain-containing protein [Candidatus Uhrbacteria bacterium]